MKKLIFFLMMTIFFISASAQIKLPVDKFIYSYVGTPADTVTAVTTTWAKEILLNKLDGVFYNAKVKVSDVTAGATCTIALQGKIFDTDAYSTIATHTWAGGGTDTTVVFTGNTNKIYYRYLKILVTRTANKLKVNGVDLSLKK